MDETPRKKRKYGNRPREDKSSLSIPKCPFCDQAFEKPSSIWGEFTEFTGGRCDCGAAYICDETGKNLGETLMDALVLLCDNDWDRALSLVPGEEYEEDTISYDPMRHKIKRSFRDRMRGKLIFVKLKK
ncbi:MAG: hypothetical protein JSV21_09005 [Nitrospirota bacterium]|nr:MAG: hypothetical protein JSV21_09005 [Nitrospirota bacterium]